MNCLFALNVRKPFVFLSSLALVVPALFFASARLGDGALSPSAHAARFTARDGARKQTPVRRPDFVENRGQWETPARFVARVGEVTAAFEPSAIRLRLGREPSATLGLVFEGASSRATLAGERRREGRYNFLVGPRASWRSNVAAYESVLYHGLYEGVRVRAREEAGRLEYDLLLDAGASLEAVRLRAEGADALELGDDGSLLVRVGQEVLRQTPPRTWEVLPGGARRTVECRFRLLDAHSYGFEAQRSDTTLPLVIDPGLEWATYMGGGRQEEIYDVASANDGTGDSISVGVTMSPDFSGRVQPVSGFVVRFNSAGALVYKTILGGSDREWIRAVAVASGGQPVVVGESYSPDYPTTPNAYDTTHAVGADSRPGADAFVTRLSADGSQLVFSTFIGTSEHEQALAVALSPTGAVYLAGETASNAFPTTSGAYDRTHNCCTPFGAGSFSIQDAFVARLSADGSALEYSTYFGGHGDEIPTDLVVDSSGFVTFTGITYSPPSGGPAMPTTSGALRTTPASGSFNPDAFIVRMKLDGEGTSDLRYSSFLGGTDTDEGYAVALDPTDPTSVIVGGITYSTVSAIRFPTTPGTLRPTSDSIDGFVMRFRFPATGGGSLVWSTLFGGFLYEEVSDVAVEPSGAIVIAGQTHSFDLPTTTGAHDRSVGITTGLLFFDAYVARLSPDGAALLYGTYLGGNHDDWHVKLALTGASTATVAGWTQSANFPASSFAFDPLLNNGGTGGPAAPTDAFVARIDLRPDGDGDDTVSAPTLLNPAPGAAAGMNTVINFDWTDVPDPSGIDGYHIQLNRRPDFACCDDWQEVWTKNSEWLATVRFDGTYYWRVQTADNSGNLSEWSEVRALNAGIGLSTVSVNPSSVTGGNSAQGQVTLSGLAPSGGASVSLSSSNPSAAAVPASVQIASGSPSANFNVTTNSAVASSTSVTISASYSGTTRTTTLTVLPRTSAPSAPTLLSPANNVRLPPNTSLTFTWSAASGATSYEIQVDDSSSFSAPLVISSRPTQTQHVLSLSSERRYWWRVRGVNAGGTAGPFSSSRTFEIRRGAPAPPPPPGPVTLSTLALSPTSVTGGGSSQGTVTLTGNAPTGGATVSLASSNTTAATVPASVTVAAGTNRATFTVATRTVGASTSVTVSASYGGVGRTATLTVQPAAPPPPPPPAASLSTLTLSPTSVAGGGTSRGTVTLTSAAPSGGAVVSLTSSNAGAASVPSSVTVAAGATSASFTVTTARVSATTSVNVSASYGGATRTASLSVTASASTDTVGIQAAEYESSKRELRVEASSNNSGAVLRCYVTSTGALIGTLTNEGGGRYRAQFSVSSNPQNITVRSSLGGSASRSVTVK